MAMAMPQVHIVAYCVDLGYGSANGARMLSLMLGAGIVSRLAFGWVADRIGPLPALLLSSSLQAASLLLYLGLGRADVPLCGDGAVRPGAGRHRRHLYPDHPGILPPSEAGARVGAVLSSTLAGMAIGGWMSGAIFDATLSYRAAFLNGFGWNLLNMAIAGWLLWRLPRRRVTSFGPRGDGLELSPRYRNSVSGGAWPSFAFGFFWPGELRIRMAPRPAVIKLPVLATSSILFREVRPCSARNSRVPPRGRLVATMGLVTAAGLLTPLAGPKRRRPRPCFTISSAAATAALPRRRSDCRCLRLLYSTTLRAVPASTARAVAARCSSWSRPPPPQEAGPKGALQLPWRVRRHLPQAGLIADASGALYGTTRLGGSIDNSCLLSFGCGTVFKLTPPSTTGGDGKKPCFTGLAYKTATAPLPGSRPDSRCFRGALRHDRVRRSDKMRTVPAVAAPCSS